MNQQKFQHIISQGEGYNIEFKQKVTKELAVEACAFLNSAGGTLLVGIDDKSKIVGVHDTNALRSRVQDIVGAITPKATFDLEFFDIDGKTVLILHFDSGNDKPYIFSGAIYVRVGANSQKLTRPEEMRDFFQQQNKIYFDSAICHNFSYPEDFNQQAYQEFIRKANISSDLPTETVLENLQVLVENNKFKNAGVLFFANEPSRHFDNVYVRGIQFKGLDKRFILDDKFFHGTLVEQYEEGIRFIKSKLRLEYDIESQGTGPRREFYEIPENVFKEALINALAHRDYYERGAVVHIEIYDDRLEISNPGGLISAIPKNEFGKRSVSRNPLVFGLLLRMQLVEKIGSGIPRMKRLMKEANLHQPDFSIDGLFISIMHRPISLLNIFNSNNLSDLQQRILEEIYADNKVTQTILIQKLNVSKTAIFNNIQKIKQLGIIERKGSDKFGFWKINPKYK